MLKSACAIQASMPAIDARLSGNLIKNCLGRNVLSTVINWDASPVHELFQFTTENLRGELLLHSYAAQQDR